MYTRTVKWQHLSGEVSFNWMLSTSLVSKQIPYFCWIEIRLSSWKRKRNKRRWFSSEGNIFVVNFIKKREFRCLSLYVLLKWNTQVYAGVLDLYRPLIAFAALSDCQFLITSNAVLGWNIWGVLKRLEDTYVTIDAELLLSFFEMSIACPRRYS